MFGRAATLVAVAVFVAAVEQHRRRRIALTRKQQRLGAWHDEPLVVCIGDGDIPNRALIAVRCSNTNHDQLKTCCYRC